MLAHLELKRVRVGHEVAAHPVGVNQFDHARRLADLVVVGRDDVLHPAHRLVRDAQRAEQVVVEAVFTEQQPVDLAQELARLRALNDAVVVRRRDRHDLADREVGQRFCRCTLELRLVLHRADTDDAALTLHQPWHRRDRAERAGIRERDRGSRKVIGGQLVRPRPPHDVLVCHPELGEVEILGTLDRRHEQLPAPVVLGHVDREPEVDVVVMNHAWLAVDLGVGRVHLRQCNGCPDDCVADDVGERDLPAASALEVVVHHQAVVGDELGRDVTQACCGRHREACFHVGDGACGRALERQHLVRGCSAVRGGRGREGTDAVGRRFARFTDNGRRTRSDWRDRCGLRGCWRGSRASDRSGSGLGGCVARGVVGEEVPPSLVDRGWILQVLLIHLVDEPFVCAESSKRVG